MKMQKIEGKEEKTLYNNIFVATLMIKIHVRTLEIYYVFHLRQIKKRSLESKKNFRSKKSQTTLKLRTYKLANINFSFTSH